MKNWKIVNNSEGYKFTTFSIEIIFYYYEYYENMYTICSTLWTISKSADKKKGKKQINT